MVGHVRDGCFAVRPLTTPRLPVSQSTFATPCAESMPGFDSGYLPSSDPAMSPEFTITVSFLLCCKSEFTYNSGAGSQRSTQWSPCGTSVSSWATAVEVWSVSSILSEPSWIECSFCVYEGSINAPTTGNETCAANPPVSGRQLTCSIVL